MNQTTSLSKKLFSLVIEYPWLFGGIVILAEISAVLMIFQNQWIADFVNRVVFQHQKLDTLTKLLMGIIALIFFRGLMIFFSEFAAKKMAVEIKSKFRDQIIRKMTRLRTLGDYSSASLQTILVDGVESLEGYFSQYLPQIILSALIPLTIILFVFPLDRLTFLVMLFTAPLVPFFMVLIGNQSQKETDKQWHSLNRMAAFFLDSIQGIKTLLLLNQGERQIDRIERVSQEYRERTMQVLRVTFLSALVLELISTLSTAVLAVEIGLRLLYGWLPFEKAFFVLLIAPEFYLPMRNLGLRFHAAKNGLAAAKSIYQFLALPEPFADIKTTNRNSLGINPGGSISLQNISVKFPNQKQSVLTNITCDFPFGMHTVIAGKSGSGKSTLMRVILQLIQPTSGIVYWNGEPLAASTTENLWQLISWLPQNPYFIPGSIEENLRLSRRTATDNEIWEVLELAELADFVRSQPDGLKTHLGEMGNTLSSGQKQRLALARVFLKDSPVLLFDEPTSMLDSVTQSFIFNKIENLRKDKTVISIAHRLKTLISADQVVFLEDGYLLDYGAHSVLLARHEGYQNFVDAFKKENRS